MLCRIMFLCFVCLQARVTTDGAEHSDHTEEIDPYESILEHLNITQSQFSLSKLDELVEDFFDKFHCINEVEKMCSRSLCMEAEEIYKALGLNTSHMLQKKDVEELSNVLVYGAMQISSNCYKKIALASTIGGTRSQLIQTITGSNSSTEISALEFENILKLLNITYGDAEIDEEYEDHHDDEDEHEHDQEKSHEDEDMQLTIDDCLSAGLMFDHLHKNPKEPMTSSLVDKTSAFIVHHILKGSRISKNCRLLPRRWYFIDELYQGFNSKNGLISQHDFEDLMEKLNLIQEKAETIEVHDHNNRRKRAVEPPITPRSEQFMQTNKCFTGNELLAIYESADGISKHAFEEICPSLIYQQISNSCDMKLRNNDTTGHRDTTIAERYGYSTLANIIICLCSVLAAFFIPCASSSTYKVAMAIFLGLAVGTLTSDAFLHLLPMAFGVHGHSEDEHDSSEEKVLVEPYLLYALVGLAGIYAFYLLETVMSLVYGEKMHHGHSHGHNPAMELEHTIPEQCNHTSSQITESYNSKSNLNLHEEGAIPNGDLSTTSARAKKRLLTPIAIMVILGDSIHNFADGMALGAAFAQSVPTGIATAITVFCHELPHELGDFAILVASGLSIFQAAMFNLLSSLTSFVGLYLGLSISTDETIRMWIFAAAAGMFLYISLVDMLPSLIHSLGTDRKKQFLYHNIGILLGFTILFLIAIFEERITL